jgi:gas vesicle protein
MRNFLIGLGMGVVAGSMIAPASGDETRARIRGKAEEILDGARGRANWIRQNVGMLGDAVQNLRKPSRRAQSETGSSTEERGSRARESSAGEPESGWATRLNTISREELLQVYGIGPVLADKILQNRPYKRPEEVVERGILPQSTFENLRETLGRKSA